MQEGKKYMIHSYKHNSEVHRSWDEAVYIGENDEYQIFGNYKTLVVESDGRSWQNKRASNYIFF